MPTVPSSPALAAAHQALYRRWRAQRFDQIVGQTAVVETLRNGVRLGRLAHGFLFVGPRGTGKTSMARILAKAVNCPNVADGEPCDRCPSCDAIREGRALDVVEMDAASNNKVDDMRELLPRVYTAPADLRRKVFIIDEVQRIKEGWDVLLKTLEEPPDDVFFIFCTTNPSQIRPAVVSRLQRFTFRPLTVAEISGKLERILADDGRTAEPAAVRLVAELAAGGMRDAESMLDQLLSSAAETITADGVRELLGFADSGAVEAFVDALVRGDALAGIAVIDRLETEGRDLVAFADQVVARLRAIVVARLGGSAGEPDLPPAALAELARRVAGLDATRSTAGGFRFQLELLLLRGLPTTAPSFTPLRPAPPPPSDVPAPARAPARRRPAPEPAASPEAVPVPMSGDALERLRRGWRELVGHVSANPANRPLIEACRPVEVRDGIVILGFPEDQSFLRDIAERKKRVLEDAVRHVLGADYGVRCIATNVAALEPLPDEAADTLELAQRVFGGDLMDVAEIS
ncbi:MAG: polymerase III subunit gamma and tau, DNA polymerase III subunit gamma/tau protein [Chloroflexi bacterium CSP1-4]|nr:MAG: polymerase III subunit gamma and tau, DNA polymerase III subunit gamma/tau protein [Chloroflexi bacterium CSP1-4]